MIHPPFPPRSIMHSPHSFTASHWFISKFTTLFTLAAEATQDFGSEYERTAPRGYAALSPKPPASSASEVVLRFGGIFFFFLYQTFGDHPTRISLLTVCNLNWHPETVLKLSVGRWNSGNAASLSALSAFPGSGAYEEVAPVAGKCTGVPWCSLTLKASWKEPAATALHSLGQLNNSHQAQPRKARPQMIYFCFPGRTACEKGRRSPDSSTANRHFIMWRAPHTLQWRVDAEKQVEAVRRRGYYGPFSVQNLQNET